MTFWNKTGFWHGAIMLFLSGTSSVFFQQDKIDQVVWFRFNRWLFTIYTGSLVSEKILQYIADQEHNNQNHVKKSQ